MFDCVKKCTHLYLTKALCSVVVVDTLYVCSFPQSFAVDEPH